MQIYADYNKDSENALNVICGVICLNLRENNNFKISRRFIKQEGPATVPLSPSTEVPEWN